MPGGRVHRRRSRRDNANPLGRVERSRIEACAIAVCAVEQVEEKAAVRQKLRPRHRVFSRIPGHERSRHAAVRRHADDPEALGGEENVAGRIPPVALAQDKPTAIGIGYQLVNSDDLLFPIGLNLDASAGLTRRVAVVGEASWSRSSSQQFGLRDITTVLAAAAGVRWSLSPDRRLSPFAQMLVGLERERSDVERFGVDWTSSALL